MSPGQNLAAESLGVLMINSSLSLSKTAVVSKPLLLYIVVPYFDIRAVTQLCLAVVTNDLASMDLREPEGHLLVVPKVSDSQFEHSMMKDRGRLKFIY
jgi:hypothetical protein